MIRKPRSLNSWAAKAHSFRFNLNPAAFISDKVFIKVGQMLFKRGTTDDNVV